MDMYGRKLSPRTKDKYRSTLALLLATKRREAGLSQSEAAGFGGVTMTTYWCWERGLKLANTVCLLRALRLCEIEIGDSLLDMESLGAQIREARLGLGLSRRMLAGKVDITRRTVCRWEGGGLAEHFDRLLIFRGLGLQPSDFLDEDLELSEYAKSIRDAFMRCQDAA